MVDAAKSWFKENQVLLIALLGQALIAGAYMVNLEARVSTLETRGSSHLESINNRLTVTEKETAANAQRLERIVDVMTKKLNVNP